MYNLLNPPGEYLDTKHTPLPGSTPCPTVAKPGRGAEFSGVDAAQAGVEVGGKYFLGGAGRLSDRRGRLLSLGTYHKQSPRAVRLTCYQPWWTTSRTNQHMILWLPKPALHLSPGIKSFECCISS